MPLSAGDQLGPYEILTPIGAGGMGEVYRARDPRLNRDVAIKVSDAEFSKRFEREAKSIAALNHPNICQVYDVGPNYLVMEFIEGAPLHGPLPLDEALRYAVQIADALSAAHAKGITHRDLKPANILVTAHGIKLLDFGLALLSRDGDGRERATDATATIGMTQAGTILGTAAYMSPEQAEAKPVDARSDIFSFGLVLYEMLSGRRAFTGDSAIAIMAAILHEEPERLQAPPALQSILMRCLRKSPADRFPSIVHVKEALLAITSGMGTPVERIPSIAVLPFANISADKENEYFSDGLAEEILNLLAKIRGLKVIARTSSFAFRGKEQDITKIAEVLRVQNILEGSVRRSGNRIRVTAQLINADDGSHLWSERYDRDMTDVFAIQDEIGQAIAVALRVHLGRTSRHYIPAVPAYEAYLKARHCLAAFTRESLPRSRDFYYEAIALDSGMATAHSGLAMALVCLVLLGITPAHVAMPLAQAAANRAFEIDEASQEAHAVSGMIAALYHFDWNEAERRFRLATAREPVSPYVRWYYSFSYLLPMGRGQESVRQCMRGMEDDPLNFIGGFHYAGALLAAGHSEAGEAYLRQLSEFHLSLYQPYYLLALSQAIRGLHKEALTAAERAFGLASWSATTKGLFGGLLRCAGEANRANELHDELLAGEQYGAPMGLCLFHLCRSEIEHAAEWAERAVEQRDTKIILLMGLMRAFRPNILHSNSRWSAIARTLGIPLAILNE